MKLRTLLAGFLAVATAFCAQAASEPESPDALPTPTATAPRKARSSKTQYFEPVRPISPPPKPNAAHARPIKSPTVRREASSRPEESAAPSESSTPVVSIPTDKTGSQVSTIAPSEIKDYDNYSVDVRKLVDLALDLIDQNLGYKYNSADPALGGMDCSGFIYYVLSKAGIKGVPRDARDQYTWARNAGNFQAVLSQHEDTSELNALKPGDLLFWANTYGAKRDPDVTQAMIYLGREKGTNQRIMIGSGDGLSYKGQPYFGVSVFDFKIGRSKVAKSDEPGPMFVGYARIPGLPAD
ncbi:MAG TPA: NlpC/P60 family protein [Chthoniobacterales bacterium]|nr:NlpC/P60 family protein [Chthoniobacterales bacterium]